MTTNMNIENTTTKISVDVIMYDDNFETKYGDGYYPQMQKYERIECNYPAKKIIFELIELDINNEKKSLWYQTSNISILGLDGDICGPLLCNYLNSKLNPYSIPDSIPTIIYNRNYKQIYP